MSCYLASRPKPNSPHSKQEAGVCGLVRCDLIPYTCVSLSARHYTVWDKISLTVQNFIHRCYSFLLGRVAQLVQRLS